MADTSETAMQNNAALSEHVVRLTLKQKFDDQVDKIYYLTPNQDVAIDDPRVHIIHVATQAKMLDTISELQDAPNKHIDAIIHPGNVSDINTAAQNIISTLIVPQFTRQKRPNRQIQKEKKRLSNGWLLTHGDLQIFVPDITKDTVQKLIQYATQRAYGHRQTAAFREEIDRLRTIAEYIVDRYPDKFDIFDYLSLTKSHKFQAKTDVLLGESETGLLENNKNNSLEYQTIQLRTRVTDSACRTTKRTIELVWEPSPHKTMPVFDAENKPKQFSPVREALWTSILT